MQVLPRILTLANILQDFDVSSKIETVVDIDRYDWDQTLTKYLPVDYTFTVNSFLKLPTYKLITSVASINKAR